MKKALVKDTIKEIKNTYRRFISILLMALLGVGFFAGIRASSPDMLSTIDNFFKESNVYDIEVISTLGLTEQDIEELKNIKNVEQVYGTYSQDSIINIEDTESVAKILCVEEVNKPLLKEGRLPQNENECVVEPEFLESNNKKIGDKLEVEINSTTNDEGEEISFLKQKELEIVGTVESPLYISRDKGTSKLGSGKVNYYLYVNKENINATDVYTEIYIKVKDSNKYITSSKEYEDYINEVKEEIENVKQNREESRHNMLVDKATEKLEEAQKTLDDEITKAEDEFEKANQEIQSGKNQAENGQLEIDKNKKKADNQFASAQKQLNNAKSQIQSGEEELKAQEEQANRQIADAQNLKSKYQTDLSSVVKGIEEINVNYKQILEALKNPNLQENQKEGLERTKKELEKKIADLEGSRQQLESGINQIDQSIEYAKSQIETGKQKLQDSKEQLTSQENSLQSKKQTAYSEIKNAQKTIDESKEKLSQGESELKNSEQEFNEKIEEAQEELDNERTKISDIKTPTWYILDRNSNQGYTSFIQDTKSVESIGAVFPIVFFLIATLISLTSMTRMVEEERTQIGTLKALGYSRRQIASKYIIYASLACVLGGSLGMVIGCQLLPRIIWMMYSMMYKIESFVVEFNWLYSIIGLIAAYICIVGATIYASLKELTQNPAILMRPKAPKNGKRVMLERIPIIWNHLTFTRKVTVRNIFRYKKRFLMTIIGILGCTSLIVTGFGMKDSIMAIIPNQFEKVFQYDLQISIKSELGNKKKEDLLKELNQKEEIERIIETNIISGNLVKNDNKEEVQIIVPKDKSELEEIISLNNEKTKQKEDIKDDEIIITSKVAQLIGAKENDIVKIKDSDEEEKEFKVSAIVENYVGHYVYMSKDLYEKEYEKYKTNVLYVKDKDLTQDEEDRLVKEIVEKEEVSSVTSLETLMKTINDMMSSLNYVVIVLIVSAGILAFVVLYNLANVNISERIRELATIKVLGFYDKEVYNYIARETVILTIIGIILGLFAGYFLNMFILQTCEINALRFAKIVKPVSYLYSVLITIIFTLIVNIVTYFSLKKIDMIESLKSVE